MIDLNYDDDDTGRIREALREKLPSDPGEGIRELNVAFVAHEAKDERRHRMVLVGLGLVLTAASSLAGAAWSAHADAAMERRRLEDLVQHVEHIESQMDHIMERMDDR